MTGQTGKSAMVMASIRTARTGSGALLNAGQRNKNEAPETRASTSRKL